MDPKHCAVLMPVFDSIEPAVEERLRELSKRGYAVRFLKGCSDIVMARSIMASEALADGFAETMWIDSDVLFELDDVEKLRGHNRPLTCGLYCRKGIREFAAVFYASEKPVVFGQGGGLLAVKYAGLGFAHVRAEVYAAVKKSRGLPDCERGPGQRRFTPYFLPAVIEDNGFQYLGEDSGFFHHAARCGCPPLADTTIKLRHRGKYDWSWDDFDERQYVSLSLVIGERKDGGIGRASDKPASSPASPRSTN